MKHMVLYTRGKVYGVEFFHNKDCQIKYSICIAQNVALGWLFLLHKMLHCVGRLSQMFFFGYFQPDPNRVVNLLQERNILPPEGPEIPSPKLPPEYKKVNCSSE